MAYYKAPLTATIFIILLFTLVTITSGAPFDEEMTRPNRPSSFNSMDEVKEYVNRLKDYYKVSTGGRYGKRDLTNTDILRKYLMMYNQIY